MGLMVFGIIVRRGLTEPPGMDKNHRVLPVCRILGMTGMRERRRKMHNMPLGDLKPFPGRPYAGGSLFNEANGNFFVKMLLIRKIV